MKVLAIAAGILLLLVFFCCGVGALFTSTKPSPRLSDAVTDKGTSHDAETQHTNPAESRDPDKGLASAKVDRILSARTAKYEQQLAAWEEAAAGRQKAESALTQARSKLEAMEKNKPVKPKFEPRTWSTIGEDYKVEAVLTDTNNDEVTIKNADGKTVTVPKEKLIYTDRLYIDDAFEDLTSYREARMVWEAENEELTKERVALETRVADAEKPKPTKPTRTEIEEEQAALEAERKEQERLAMKEAARRREEAAARKAEEEYEENGLVLLRKSVKGTTGEFGGQITGVVENRRSRKLRYAEITFNLYDDSGAQVGSALANINGLEPGGKWKFEASSIGTDFSAYKISELSGF